MVKFKLNKIIKPWSRLSTLPRYPQHQKNTQKPMWPWPLGV